ncbi:hypothetical protein AUO94_00450 [Planococcus kocurii]|uniref:HTH merR-type domain-containing protein n=1 Tax=Planococcus kocurii TaxID=1374 RepID=A0ABM5WSD7_9BACL|nr:hypothetical protein [Planococcus kocurii]ALS77203.1 hypothetical protein AUO94_00450 [Planococcus kocurii]
MSNFSHLDMQLALGIQVSTLRKYAMALEQHGYIFNKNNQGHRLYTEKDVDAFLRLISYKKLNGMTIDRNAKAVVEWIRESIAEDAMENYFEREQDTHSLMTMTLEGFVQLQSEHIKTQSKQLENQELIVNQQKEISNNIMSANNELKKTLERMNKLIVLQQELIARTLGEIENSEEMVGILTLKKKGIR